MNKNENLSKILESLNPGEIFTLAEVIKFIEKDLNYLADQHEKYQGQEFVPIPRHGLGLLIFDFKHLLDKLVEIEKVLVSEIKSRESHE